MINERKRFGFSGEEMAANFLVARGFRILARNWNHRLGEIDLIVERDGRIRFVEVKMRRSLSCGYPEASITGKKLRHLARVIECWLEKQYPIPTTYQVDAISITWLPCHDPEFCWIEAIL